MKKLSLIFFVLSVFLGTVQAQNDTIFILEDGEITGRYKTTEIDSIIFYRPAIVDSLNIESTKFLDMAISAANYIDTNQKIPNVTYIDASQTRNVSAAEFYYMMARWLRYLKVNGEQVTPPPVRIVRGTAVPPTPTGSMSGTFTKVDILTKGQSNADFIDANSYVPNCSTVDSTQYSPVAIYYAMAKTIRYYAQNNHVLPTSVTITQIDGPDTWTATLVPPTNTDSLNVVNTQFLDIAIRAANYIDTNHQIPNMSYIDASQTRSVSAAEFYYMMARWLRYLKNNGEQAPSTIKIIRGTAVPPTPTGSMSGTFTKDDILTKGQSNADFIEENGYVPNYSTVGSTQYSPVAIYYAMAKTIRYYAQNNHILPATVSVTQVAGPDSWPTSSTYPWSRTLSVPYTEQPDGYTCGPTSLRMVMAFYGVSKTVSEISNYMASWGDSPYYDGVGPNAIVAAAQHYGFSSTVTQYGWDNLKNAIAAGHPVIANIQILANNYPRYYPSNSPAYTSYSGGHFVVVVGLQANADGSIQYVVVNDPSRGTVKYTYSSFETSWVNNKNRLLIRLR